MKALLIVDVQNDFCLNGSLAVTDGDDVVPVINLLTGFDLVVATVDHHPANHGSFASQHLGKKPFEMGTLSGNEQMLWPDHCVQGSHGAELHPDLRVPDHVILKGTNLGVDSYSGFFDANGHSTGLVDLLKKEGITGLCVVGLTTEYCVKLSVLDALKEGFAVSVLMQAVRPVGMRAGDEDHAVQEMCAAGAIISW